LYVFGSVEIAQKDMWCVQVIDVRTQPNAYMKFNPASNVQIYIPPFHLSGHSNLNFERRIRDAGHDSEQADSVLSQDFKVRGQTRILRYEVVEGGR